MSRRSIFRVTVQRQPAPDAALAQALAAGAAALSSGNGARTAAGGPAGVAAGLPAGLPRRGSGCRPAGSAATSAGPGSAIVRGAVPAAPAARNVRESLGDEPVAAAAAPVAATGQAPAQPGFTPTGARIGRNDPCWCGSGAKYKKCHGR